MKSYENYKVSGRPACRRLARSSVARLVPGRCSSGCRPLLSALIAAMVFATPALSAAGVGRVLGVEAGYGVVSSSRDLTTVNPHGLVTSLYYGYVIKDRPRSMTVLSIASGYDYFPVAPGVTVLHNLVYGVEYAHLYSRQGPVSLVADYGLLFNLLFDQGRSGYAFGHHTRLGLGAVWNLDERHKLTLKGSYNIVTFPYFESSRNRYSFLAATLRYSLFF